MTEPPNPFEQHPELQPTLVVAADALREFFQRAGLPLSHFVIAIRLDPTDSEPLCTAVSWPLDELPAAADLARQARTIFEMQHASKRTKGGG